MNDRSLLLCLFNGANSTACIGVTNTKIAMEYTRQKMWKEMAIDSLHNTERYSLLLRVVLLLGKISRNLLLKISVKASLKHITPPLLEVTIYVL
jgi:hypothetical protein